MANEYLQRLPTTTGNTKVFTISCWLKHQYNNGSHLDILHAYNGSASNRFQLMLQPSYELSFFSGGSSSRFAKSVSDGGTGYANFRDSSAWMHVVGVMNTTAGEEGQRCKIYINGVLKANDAGGWPGTTNWHTNGLHFGRGNNNSMYFWKGDMGIFKMYGKELSAEEVMQNFQAHRGRFRI